jgi:hypothetical protein
MTKLTLEICYYSLSRSPRVSSAFTGYDRLLNAASCTTAKPRPQGHLRSVQAQETPVPLQQQPVATDTPLSIVKTCFPQFREKFPLLPARSPTVALLRAPTPASRRAEHGNSVKLQRNTPTDNEELHENRKRKQKVISRKKPAGNQP